MKTHWIMTAALAFALTVPAAARAEGIVGLWRFDIINSAGTTLGAMTVQTRDTVQRQANEQHRWALATGQGASAGRSQIQAPGQTGLAGYTGFVMTDQGGHALPIESIDVRDGAMTMVVNRPRQASTRPKPARPAGSGGRSTRSGPVPAVSSSARSIRSAD